MLCAAWLPDERPVGRDSSEDRPNGAHMTLLSHHGCLHTGEKPSSIFAIGNELGTRNHWAGHCSSKAPEHRDQLAGPRLPWPLRLPRSCPLLQQPLFFPSQRGSFYASPPPRFPASADSYAEIFRVWYSLHTENLFISFLRSKCLDHPVKTFICLLYFSLIFSVFAYICHIFTVCTCICPNAM